MLGGVEHRAGDPFSSPRRRRATQKKNLRLYRALRIGHLLLTLFDPS
jgi:hypothetical protein